MATLNINGKAQNVDAPANDRISVHFAFTHWEERMESRMAFWKITLLGALAVFAAACSTASTTRVSMTSMCKASGGTYSGGTCLPASNPQTAAQLCVAHGGVYMSGGDYCEVDNGLLWKPLP